MSDAFVQFAEKETNAEVNQIEDVRPDEVSEMKDKLCIVDVRETDEYHGDLGHIPGSRLIVLSTLQDNLQSLPRDKTIVFVCRSGRRSAGATLMAHDNGFESAFNMKGGMLLWNQLGLETSK